MFSVEFDGSETGSKVSVVSVVNYFEFSVTSYLTGMFGAGGGIDSLLAAETSKVLLG